MLDLTYKMSFGPGTPNHHLIFEISKTHQLKSPFYHYSSGDGWTLQCAVRTSSVEMRYSPMTSWHCIGRRNDVRLLACRYW